MKYRQFKKAGIKVSEISLGAEHIEKAPYGTVNDIIDIAVDSGVNYVDLFMGSPDIRDHFGRSLKGRRDKMMIAGHLGAVWINNQYTRTRDMKLIKQFFFDLLKRLRTDYIDMLMFHFVDEIDDLNVCLNNGMLEFAQTLKEKGIVRMLGISSHIPAVAKAAVETEYFDGIMFSINPLFDIMPADSSIETLLSDPVSIENEIQINDERHSLYVECEKKDVGIIVMKAFAGGQLLQENSPVKMTTNQCIHYSLSKPGVVTSSLGCRTVEEFAHSLKYVNAKDSEKIYSPILKSSFKWNATPRCLYCNHCLPCPQGIDIAEAMRTIDIGGSVPKNCNGCGICEKRCPFGIPVSEIFKS